MNNLSKCFWILILFGLSSSHLHANNYRTIESPLIERYQDVPIPLIQQIEDEELIQKMKNGILALYDEKRVKFGEFDVSKESDEITISGDAEIHREQIDLSATFSTKGSLQSIEGSFGPGKRLKNRTFKRLSQGATLKQWFPQAIQKSLVVKSLLMEFEGVKPQNLTLKLATSKAWNLLQYGSLNFNKIEGELAVENPSGSKSFSANLNGEVSLGGSSISLNASVGNSKEAWKLTGQLKNIGITKLLSDAIGSVAGLPMPDGFAQFDLDETSFTVYPANSKFQLTGSASLNGAKIGDAELFIAKNSSSKKMEFLVGIAPSQEFKFASFEPSLKIIDALQITNFGLVLSSSKQSSTSLKVFERLGGESSIGRGLNFIGSYDLTPTGLDELVGVKTLMLRSVLSNRANDILLEAKVGTDIPFSDAASLKGIIFRLKPFNMEFSMGGEMHVIADTEKLIFKTLVGIDVQDQSIFVEGSMAGEWKNPFGAKGLSLADMWLRFDVGFKTSPFPLPGLGIAGKLKAKSFQGDLMLVINLNNPTESAIDVGFNKIDVKSILESFCDAKTLAQIPKELRSTILDISLENARLTVVPRPLTINEVSYDAGFRVKGDAAMGDDFAAKLDIQVGYDGIEAMAGLKAIKYPPYFELKGSRGKPDPAFEIVAKMNKPVKVAITGSATVLGLTAEADMMLNDQGFDLFMKGKIWDVFMASLELEGSSVKDGGSFRVAATMEQDFLDYAKKHGAQAIDDATKTSQKAIRDAQAEISSAQAKVATLDKQIEEQRRIVRAERERDLGRLRSAQNEVAKERQKVQGIQSNINAAHRSIASIDRQVKAKDKWINEGDNFIEVGARGTASLPFFTQKAAERTAKMSEIAALETAKFTADKVLLAAQETVGAMHSIGKEVPVDADIRIAGLFTAKEVPIKTMEAAKLVLEGANIISTGTLDAAKWIVENGPLGVLNVTYSHFEGKLNATHGGTVRLHLKGTIADKPFDEKVSFNFNNPLDEVVKFAKGLL